jgi:hypothetical protein
MTTVQASQSIPGTFIAAVTSLACKKTLDIIKLATTVKNLIAETSFSSLISPIGIDSSEPLHFSPLYFSSTDAVLFGSDSSARFTTRPMCVGPAASRSNRTRRVTGFVLSSMVTSDIPGSFSSA